MIVALYRRSLMLFTHQAPPLKCEVMKRPEIVWRFLLFWMELGPRALGGTTVVRERNVDWQPLGIV